jgi:hypothetical protein
MLASYLHCGYGKTGVIARLLQVSEVIFSLFVRIESFDLLEVEEPFRRNQIT